MGCRKHDMDIINTNARAGQKAALDVMRSRTICYVQTLTDELTDR